MKFNMWIPHFKFKVLTTVIGVIINPMSIDKFYSSSLSRTTANGKFFIAIVL